MVIWEELRSGQPTYDGRTTHTRFLVRRAKVPGGWFVLLDGSQTNAHHNQAYDYKTEDPAIAAFFYPDPEHRWDGKSLP